MKCYYDDQSYRESEEYELPDEKNCEEENENCKLPDPDKAGYCGSYHQYRIDRDLIERLTEAMEEEILQTLILGSEDEKRLSMARWIESNLRLLDSIVGKYRGCGVDTLELLDECVLYLLENAKKYDHTKAALSTFVYMEALGCVNRTIHNQSRIVRIPSRAYEDLSTWNKIIAEENQRLGCEADTGQLERAFTARSLWNNLGRRPTEAEIDRKLGQTKFRTKLRFIRENSQTIFSLDTPLGDDEETSHMDQLSDWYGMDPEDFMLDRNLSTAMAEAFTNLLDSRERIILYEHKVNGCSLQCLSDQFKISKERVRQIETRALKKLRNSDLRYYH